MDKDGSSVNGAVACSKKIPDMNLSLTCLFEVWMFSMSFLWVLWFPCTVQKYSCSGLLASLGHFAGCIPCKTVDLGKIMDG